MALEKQVSIPAPLVNWLRAAERVVVMTGAGVSAESGVPTFRDAQTGLWSRYRPEELATPEAFGRDPRLVWDWYRWRRDLVQKAEPNAAHHALVQMETHVHQMTLVTQNVDGLHRRAGSRSVIELHGSLERARCQGCGQRAQEWPETDEELPRCSLCGDLLRPDVVWFGEALPRAAIEQAAAAALGCDLFLVVGTSGVVEPAALLPYLAKDQGAVLAVVNPEETPQSEVADFFLPGRAGDVLPVLIQQAWPQA